MKKFTIDARTLPCPQPLLRTKEALEKENFQELEVLVDNKAARENVTRFLKKSGLSSLSVEDSGESLWTVRALRSSESQVATGQEPSEVTGSAPFAGEAGGKRILILSDCIGNGDEKLGALLMKGFLYTLTQVETLPECLIFMNTGVKLSCEGSESLEDLKTLESRGCRIISCGTCLDFYGLTEKKGVGEISNMYEIASLMTAPSGSLTIS